MTLVDHHGAIRATVPCAACDRPVQWDQACRLEGADGRTVELCADCDPFTKHTWAAS